ncbi:MAG: hypothetical protein JSU07_11170 [Bacteroidetes bacterium]|nr:hypothetical protein [Bacteroidota bacterium]
MIESINSIEKTKIARGELLLTLLIYLSMFSNSYTFFQQPFEFYFGYLIYIVLLPVFIRRFGLNKNLGIIFTILALAGFLNIAVGNNTFPLFFKVFLGLMLSYFFYDSVIRFYDFDIEQLFKWYLKAAYIISIIGLIQFISFQIGFKLGYDYTFILNKWGVTPGGNFGIRINAIFSEPTYLASSISAAFFVSVYNLTRKNNILISKFQSLVIIATFFLSFSSLGQLGMLLTIILLMLNLGMAKYIFIIIGVLMMFFNILYNNVSEFRERYDSLTELSDKGASSFKLGKTHGSSFILYNNYIVTVENFKNNFVFGGGIGSHPIAFAKYNIAKDIKVEGFANNSADANSMFLRVVSETGLFGVFIVLYIIFKFYITRNKEHETYHWLVSNSILVMILLNMFRQGHYFLNGFPFFLLLYVYNSFSYKKTMTNLSTDAAKPSSISNS